MKFSTILHLDSYHRDNVVNKVIDVKDARRKVERMSNKRKVVEYAEDKNETRNEPLSKILKPSELNDLTNSKDSDKVEKDSGGVTTGTVNPLSEEDVHGKSALDYAFDGGNGKLSNFLQDITNVPLKKRQKPKGMTSKISDNADFKDNPEHDYVNDAKTILEKLQAYEKTSKKPPGPEIDALSGMADWGQIIEDSTTGFHGDVLLSEVESIRLD